MATIPCLSEHPTLGSLRTRFPFMGLIVDDCKFLVPPKPLLTICFFDPGLRAMRSHRNKLLAYCSPSLQPCEWVYWDEECIRASSSYPPLVPVNKFCKRYRSISLPVRYYIRCVCFGKWDFQRVALVIVDILLGRKSPCL